MGNYQNEKVTSFLRQSNPVATSAMPLNEAPQRRILVGRPRASLHIVLVTARSSPHHTTKTKLKEKKKKIQFFWFFSGRRSSSSSNSEVGVVCLGWGFKKGSRCLFKAGSGFWAVGPLCSGPPKKNLVKGQ